MLARTAALAAALGLVATAAWAEPSARQLELSRRYVSATKMHEMMGASLKATMPAMLAELARSTELTAEEQAIVAEVSAEAAAEMMTGLVDALPPILADTFTEQELAGLVAFYESPLGQSLVAKTPQMALKLAPLASQLSIEMRAGIRDRICARMDCKPAPAAAKAS